ncbi:hypothetical protein [Chitinophaga sp.]|uniref:hypothetical protein n=1 Tax=Chitinophaga sp. TaxID=1869181 RepID=UPI0031E0DF63
MKKDDAIRKKLHEFIDAADSRALRALESIVGGGQDSPWWNNEEFVAEMKRRWKDYEEGREKAFSHEEAMEMVERGLKKVKHG